MDDAHDSPTAEPDLLPRDPTLQPHVTIRGQAAAYLVYDVDPEQIPTETISHGGRRIAIDDAGGVREQPSGGRSRYEVLDKISEGGGGIVYGARERALRRDVALKICRVGLNPDSGATLEAGEFTNEAYMTARLDHPGVVPIYALAKDAEGRPFFAMKRVVGMSWKDLLHPDRIRDPERRRAAEARAAGMTWRDQIEVLLKVCDAVAFAHSKAILHRDLKPENIMLGEYGEVFVMDWGLAIYFDERNEYRRFPGLKPQLAGTPYYIAPEMVRGELATLGPASDVYLLGGILYEVITGRPPHDGDTVMDILRNAATGQVMPPDEIPDAPCRNPALAHIAMNALEPRIADRFLRVADFREALRGVLAHYESMAVGARAAEGLAAVRRDFDGAGGDGPATRRLDEDATATACGQLSESIGGFRQAIDLWAGNLDARRGLLDAIDLQIRLAIQQDDLVLARVQLRLLRDIRAACPEPELAAAMEQADRERSLQIERRQAALDRAARQVRLWKLAAAVLAGLVLAGLAAIVTMSQRQRVRAVRREQDMFAASVVGRADMLGQFMDGIEQIALLYRQTAVDLLSSPPDRLPWRDPTPAGRDGFYLDEDFLRPEARPPGMAYNQRYKARLSMDHPALLLPPRAHQEDRRAEALDHAARLGRLDRVFAHAHRARRDILWSVAATESGAMAVFPGFGRAADAPRPDPADTAWYRATLRLPHDRPVWGRPYADDTTESILMNCTCRIHMDGRTIGVIGVEVALGTIHRMLLDFSLSVGGRRRSLLVRSAEEPDPDTGAGRMVHRVLVDSYRPQVASDWAANGDLPTLEETDPQIAAYFQGVLARERRSGACHELGDDWIAHAQVRNRAWTFIAVLQHGR